MDGKSVVLSDGTEVKITDSTSMAEIDGSDTAIISNVSKKDYVTVVYDTENKAYGIYLLQAYSTDNTGILNIKSAPTTDLEKGTDGVYRTTSTTASDILGDMIFPMDSTKKIVAADPANLDAAKTAANVPSLSSGTNYYIVVISEDGSSFSSNKLSVLSGAMAPTFGTNLSASQAGYATLTVNATVSDGGTVTYQWYKGGEAISGATAPSYTPTEAGVYYVIATNTLSTGAKATTKSTECTVSAPGNTADLSLLEIDAATGTPTVNTADVKGGSAKITAIAGNGVKISFTAALEQFVTVKIGNRVVLDDVQGSGAKDSTSSVEYKLMPADIAAGELTVTVDVREDGKVSTHNEYKVTVEQTKATAPSAITLSVASGGSLDQSDLLTYSSVALTGAAASTSELKLVVTAASADKGIKVSTTTTGDGTVVTDKTLTSGDSAQTIYTLGANDNSQSVTITVTVSQTGYADWTGTYTVSLATA